MGILQRLELENFKSYKGYQVIGPFTKFAAIIGPNGAGKSNLMDAISFVLGDKTSNLRVRSLKDLIHGAVVGKAAANRAYVTAVYLEANGDEIHFTRTIIGNGSEYRIDGKVVAPPEYQTKLESLGILIKAKNFLVFQGAVESIAMKTPKERTDLFEQISRSDELKEEYDRLKNDMNAAQEDTNFSYHKRKGIAAEKREARAEKDEAEKFQQLSADLNDTRLEAQLFKLFHTDRKMNSLKEDLSDINKQLMNENRRRDRVEDDLKKKKSDIAKVQREQALLDKAVKDKEMELNLKRPKYIKTTEKVSHLQKKLDNTKKQITKSEMAHEKHQVDITELERELSEIQQMIESYELENQESQEIELEDTQMQEYNALKEKAGQQTTALRQNLTKITRQQQSDVEALDQTKQKKTDLTSRHVQLNEQKTQLEERISKLEQYINQNTQTVNKLKLDKDALAGDIRVANQRHAEITSSLETVQSELRDAKVDKHESARNQRRAECLESMKRLFPGVCGRLIDLCEPVHRRYQISITKVLGKNMDAIVVDTEQCGRDCIQYMKEQRSEPSTFIPLDSIQVKPTNEKLRNLGGTAKLVIDVIRYDPPQIKKALQYACGNALVCDTMEEARKLCFSGHERHKAVALDGTLFSKSGIISGGASDIKRKAKRWDEKAVDGLKRSRDRYLEELKELNVVRRKEPELNNLTSQINGLENRLKYSKRDRDSSIDQTMSEYNKEASTIDHELEDMEPLIVKLEEEINERAGKIDVVQTKLNSVEDSVFTSFCDGLGIENIRQYEEKQLSKQQERAKKRLEFANQQSKLQSQLDFERRRNTQGQVAKYEEQLVADEDALTEILKEEKHMLKSIDETQERLDSAKQNREEFKGQTEESEIMLKEVKKILQEHLKEISKIQKAVNSTEVSLEQKRAERHGLLKACKLQDIKLPLKQGTMDDIQNAAPTNTEMEDGSATTSTADYESMSSQGAAKIYEKESKIVIDYKSLGREIKELEDLKEIENEYDVFEKKIESMQNTLQRIIAPNMKAVEKLDTVKEKLQETTEEFEFARKKAKKAKNDFELVQKKRYDRFMDAFDHVSTRIDDIYKHLANSQSAQAFLGPENPEEPYLDGISYNCVAPGKRFRPMDNLSGGEKTVAALALLFAIHSYQPSPFFVLDEIDAALDNTNINRVARYIRKQTEADFQCIIISLKEEFYTKADCLIGIYPEEDNCIVSKTLSLDLRKYTPTPVNNEEEDEMI